MNLNKLLFTFFLFALPVSFVAKEREEVPPIQNNWDKDSDGNRSLTCTPSLFKDANFVYVYSEKQLDNLSIGITDMQGNVYHYEVTTVPAGMYYAVSIASLTVGTYYLSIYQGSNYMIGIFQK